MNMNIKHHVVIEAYVTFADWAKDNIQYDNYQKLAEAMNASIHKDLPQAEKVAVLTQAFNGDDAEKGFLFQVSFDIMGNADPDFAMDRERWDVIIEELAQKVTVSELGVSNDAIDSYIGATNVSKAVHKEKEALER